MTPKTEDLAALRGQIDEIDDQIHDLLMRRSRVVEEVAQFKSGDAPVIRPGREAQILRRILGRHQGRLAPQVVARIWREILAGATEMQGPFAVAAYAPEGQFRLWDVCREHYGAYTQILPTSDPVHAIRMVIEGVAQVGMVPWPNDRAADPWWACLVGDSDRLPQIVARLPFVADARSTDVQTLAIARVASEPTGDDHSFLVLELQETISRSRLMQTLTAEGFKPVAFWTYSDDAHGEVIQHLVEVEGFLDRHDPRLATTKQAFGEALQRIFYLGGFAMPIVVPAPAETAATRRNGA
ncbi:MAG: chorismate mutase [Rhodospirillaceae bacterium]|nr:chorismate mutase [Rhodospirillaceae bacterium]